MRQFVLAHRLRHVLLRVVKTLEYVGYTYMPEGCLRQYFFILVAGFPSRFVYFCTYVLLLPFVHYVVAAIVATVAYWALNYRLLKLWVFAGSGSVIREALLLLALHGMLQCVNLYVIYVLIEHFEWHEVLAPFGASFVYGCAAVPMTRLIFWSKQKRW